jgi:3D (Asp-Asp-Asp) domain-containing protein
MHSLQPGRHLAVCCLSTQGLSSAYGGTHPTGRCFAASQALIVPHSAVCANQRASLACSVCAGLGMSDNAVATAADDSSVIRTASTVRILEIKRLSSEDIKSDSHGDQVVCWLLSCLPGRDVVIQSSVPVLQCRVLELQPIGRILCAPHVLLRHLPNPSVSHLRHTCCQTHGGRVCHTLLHAVSKRLVKILRRENCPILCLVVLDLSASALGQGQAAVVQGV